jgi:hypothetical protein
VVIKNHLIMSKKLSIGVIFLLLLAACTHVKQDTAENKAADDTLVWNIKSCKIYSSDFEFADPGAEGMLIQEFKFNKKGFVNELIRYDMEGNEIARFDIFGENNPLPIPGKPLYIDTVLTVVELDSQGEMRQKEVKKYSENGWLTEVLIYDGSNGLIKRNTYKYNALGLIIEDIYWDIELDIPKQVIKYRYAYFID